MQLKQILKQNTENQNQKVPKPKVLTEEGRPGRKRKSSALSERAEVKGGAVPTVRQFCDAGLLFVTLNLASASVLRVPPADLREWVGLYGRN